MDRRTFLELSALASLPAFTPASAGVQSERIVNDISRLNPVAVTGERQPRTTDEVRSALRTTRERISIGGARASMGGQIAAPGSLHLDMRSMNQVISLDAPRKIIRVQAGARWRDVQDVIDPYDLSIRIMQSYSNFTVGGSVSVNCHGRYVGRGPLVNSVRAVQLVTHDGEVLELTRERESELFRAAFGGYGGLGVITEVEIDLDLNVRMERIVEQVSLDQYPQFFRDKILSNNEVIFHNADLTPPSFDGPRAISWVTSTKALTVADRLVPRGLDYDTEQNAIWAITELPGGRRLQRSVLESRLREQAVVWRNYEASLDTASLEPRTRVFSTYLLQEYFIPVANFLQFAAGMSRILNAWDVEALNVSIRHSPADITALLRWAPSEVFSFVLYYKQRTSDRASKEVAVWTRELIELALANGGRYYLPYRLDATREQFDAAYPEAGAFASLKSRVDPRGRFANLLWEKYLPRTRNGQHSKVSS